MTVAVKTSGSQSATITTEHVLATVTDAGVYLLSIDVNAMTGGATPDILEVKTYGKARSSDTERLIETYTLLGIQTTARLFQTFARISPHHYKVTITQTQGTGRTFPWAIYNA